jgi:uncharacterized phage-like protein YoqJ
MTSKSSTPSAAVDAGIVLMRLAGERVKLEDQIHRQVLAVLDAGGSWTTVSVALGVSKQSAWERYRVVPPKYGDFRDHIADVAARDV